MRKWFKHISPDRDSLLANRWLRPLAHRLTHPEIWHFNRRNVARGVALGLFVGFILPIGQIVVAALLAASARGNLLPSHIATLYGSYPQVVPQNLPFRIVELSSLSSARKNVRIPQQTRRNSPFLPRPKSATHPKAKPVVAG